MKPDQLNNGPGEAGGAGCGDGLRRFWRGEVADDNVALSHEEKPKAEK